MSIAFQRWPDDRLLASRFCDLDLKLGTSLIQPRIERLYDELEARGLRFKPYFWLSDEWFTPDGVPGIAVPFYLSHPRLIRLERQQMLEAEGAGDAECMRLLRHETGHAIDNAYRLSRRRRWRENFGAASQKYPTYYEPDPASRDFVQHLDNWYAQSHPSEDFAETFALWLQPKSGWRRRYAGWPALKKLHYVDELMQDIADKTPAVRTRAHVNPVNKIRKTLQAHYRARRNHYGLENPDAMDAQLRKLFQINSGAGRTRQASRFIQMNRAKLRVAVARWTGQPQYAVDQILSDMIKRCRELGLRSNQTPSALERELTAMVTAELIAFVHEGRIRVPV